MNVPGLYLQLCVRGLARGTIIAQQPLMVEEGWSIAELEAHIHEVEHELYPDVIQLLAEGRVHVGAGGRVIVDSAH